MLNTDSDGDTYARSSHSDADEFVCAGDAYRYARYANRDVHADRDTDRDAPHGDTDGDVDAGPDVDAATNLDAGTNLDTDANVDSGGGFWGHAPTYEHPRSAAHGRHEL